MAQKEFVERRRSPREKSNIKVKILNKEMKPIPMRDISFHGALLRSPFAFRPGETMDIQMFLPITARTIVVKARVVRVAPHRSLLGNVLYDIGVEILDMDKAL